MDPLRERVQKALAGSRADYTEIRIEEKESTRISFRGKELGGIGSSVDRGGMVRCLIRNKGWGVVTFNGLDDFASRVEQACQCAAAGSQPEAIELAPVERVEEVVPAMLGRDFRDVPLSEKKALAGRYNQLLLGESDRIVDTNTIYADAFVRLTLANSEGSYIEQEKPSIAVVASATARDDGNVQRYWKSFAGPRGFEYVRGKEEEVRQAARRAVALLEAKPVKAGRYTVIIDQELASVFIHEAFGHLSEADFVYENPRAREMMTLGRRFGPEILNVYDDGSIRNLRGSTFYDDEGTPGRRNWLIKEGKLVGRLHSRQTAARMGERPTGNARAVNYHFAPIVRMTNTAIDNGSSSFRDMIKDVKLGIYACGSYGGETMLENFSFSSAYAFMIRDGEVAEPVKDVILAGNLFTTLGNIDMVGNDFEWDLTAGGCGKSGQYPLPVGMGAPHIRIQDVVIGGQ